MTDGCMCITFSLALLCYYGPVCSLIDAVVAAQCAGIMEEFDLCLWVVMIT